MVIQFPKSVQDLRVDKLLYWLADQCHGLDKLIRKNGIDEVRKDWKQIINKLSDSQIKTGCKRVKEQCEQFINPVRFRFLSHGLIDTKLAYEQAKERIYKHDAVRLAAERSDLHRDTGTEEQRYQKFGRVYARICEKIFEGIQCTTSPEKTPPRASQTPRKPYTEADKKRCREAINNIRKMLGASML